MYSRKGCRIFNIVVLELIFILIKQRKWHVSNNKDQVPTKYYCNNLQIKDR